jgi:hypothetical protein
LFRSGYREGGEEEDVDETTKTIKQYTYRKKCKTIILKHFLKKKKSFFFLLSFCRTTIDNFEELLFAKLCSSVYFLFYFFSLSLSRRLLEIINISKQRHKYN